MTPATEMRLPHTRVGPPRRPPVITITGRAHLSDDTEVEVEIDCMITEPEAVTEWCPGSAGEIERLGMRVDEVEVDPDEYRDVADQVIDRIDGVEHYQ